MTEQQTDHNYVLGLEDNAFSSLEHGMEHYLVGYEDSDEVNLKFAVLHIFHAVELLLKARLTASDQSLLWQRPGSSHTVDYRTALERLRSVGVEFSKEDTDNLDSLRNIRNNIEHHEIKGNRQQIEDYVAKATMLLDSFVEKELGIRLDGYIRADLYKKMVDTAYSYQERLRQIKRQMEQSLPRDPLERDQYTRVRCNQCGEETVWMPDPRSTDGTVQCYNCNATFSLWTCDRCGTTELSLTPGYDRDTGVCDDCWNAVMDRD